MRFFFLWIILIAASMASAETWLVRMPKALAAKGERIPYDEALLRLLLDQTAKEFGPYRIQLIADVPQGRAIERLASNQLIDVLVTATSKEREARLRPIPYDIHQGLLGTRLLLVRRSEAARFAKVRSLSDLKAFRGIQGHDWPDTQVLRENGLTIAVGSSYPGLFRMLQARRVDYFPRSIVEIQSELQKGKLDDLVIEPRLALRYSMPAYVFTSRDNERLAKRLERGWRLALQNGSFEALFQSYHKEALELSKLRDHLVLSLENRDLARK